MERNSETMNYGTMRFGASRRTGTKGSLHAIFLFGECRRDGRSSDDYQQRPEKRIKCILTKN